MKTVAAFFWKWFARWKKREALDLETTAGTNDAQPPESPAALETVPPVEPAVTQHGIQIYPQLYGYSCAAAVLQAASAYLGLELTHARAIQLTRCKPDGATLERVAKVLKRLHRCRTRRVVRAKTVRKVLRDGAVVLAGDRLTYSEEHAILVFGCTDDYFLIMDPAANACDWKLDSWLFEAGDEFIAIWPRRSARRVPASPLVEEAPPDSAEDVAEPVPARVTFIKLAVCTLGEKVRAF